MTSKWQPFTLCRLLNQPWIASGFADADAPDRAIAAAVLASRPRKVRRRWSGYLMPGNRATRLWKGRNVILPDGRIAEALGARRGLVMVFWDDPNEVEGVVYQILPASKVRIHKMRAAVILGQGKLGTKERPSAAKAAAAQRNGSKPPRPGSRPRGRPPKRKS